MPCYQMFIEYRWEDYDEESSICVKTELVICCCNFLEAQWLKTIGVAAGIRTQVSTDQYLKLAP